MLEFPEKLFIPMDKWLDNIMDWILVNTGGFFDAPSGAFFSRSSSSSKRPSSGYRGRLSSSLLVYWHGGPWANGGTVSSWPVSFLPWDSSVTGTTP